MEFKSKSFDSPEQFAFGVEDINKTKVNAENGIMTGVSLISTGPALGHELYVDDESIETILRSLGDKLPAYITHSGALFSDRLTNEIGMFQNFRQDGNRLLADFEAFESFMKDDEREYNRLFEMAEKMPERFGLSIVFSAKSAWSTPHGDVYTVDQPDDAIFDYPSIRAEEVSSADFVDTPAANDRGLFSSNKSKPYYKMTKLELSERNEVLEAENTKLLEETTNAALSVTDAEAQVESLEIKLSEKEDAMSTLEADLASKLEDIADIESKISDIKKEMAEKDEVIVKKDEEIEVVKDENLGLGAKLDELSAKVLSFESIIKGSKMVEVSSVEKEIYEPSKSSRSKIISEFATEKGISEFSATIRLGKERPELFTS